MSLNTGKALSETSWCLQNWRGRRLNPSARKKTYNLKSLTWIKWRIIQLVIILRNFTPSANYVYLRQEDIYE
jgi:hypothetical protein